MNSDPIPATPAQALPTSWRWAIAAVLLAVLGIFFGFWWALAHGQGPFPSSWYETAEQGEGFGILSALFSGLAFAGLIITILIQSRELGLQRQQLTLQRVELEGQRAELARLANAQDAQNYALLFTAISAAEAFEKRLSSESPSPEFTEAIRYLRRHLKEETAKRQQPR